MRNHALDTARVVAMTLVVLAHGAMAYMVTPIGWAIQDDCRFIGADLFVWIVRAMVMPLFFWLSGFFARTVLVAAGPAGFLRQRATRILLPFAVALVPVSLALDALWDWGKSVAARGGVPAHVPALDASSLPLTLGHLWFLYYLLALSVIALAVARLRVRIPPIAMGTLSLVPLLVTGTLGLDTPLGFGLDPAVLAYHGAFFAWGWGAQRQADAAGGADRPDRRVWIDLAGAAVLLGLLIEPLQTGMTPTHAIVASGLFSVLLVDAALGLCMRYGDRPGKTIRRLSDASFAVYVLHLPIVVLVQILIASR